MRISDWSSDVCSSDLAWTDDRIPDGQRRHGRAVGPGARRICGEGGCRRRKTATVARRRGEPGPPADGRRVEAVVRSPSLRLRRRPLRQTRSEEHTSELQSLMRISYAVFCLKKNKKLNRQSSTNT